MKSIAIILSFILTLSVEPLPGQNDSTLTTERILELYHELERLPFDENRIASVDSLVLNRDRGRLTLVKGKLYFAKLVAGSVSAAVFLGQGRFEMNPPNHIERGQVRRFLQTDQVSEEFSAAYIRFTDGAYEEVASRLLFSKANIPDEVQDLHQRLSKYFLEQRGTNLSSAILSDLLDPHRDGLFFAVLEQKGVFNFPSYLLFAFEPGGDEELSLHQFYPRRANKPFYTICSFHQMSDYAEDDSIFAAVREEDDAMQVSHYNLDVKLEKSGKLSAAAKIHFQSLVDNLRIPFFILYQELEVDSVKSAAGDTLAFIQEEKEAGFSVILKNPLKRLQKAVVEVHYSGDAMQAAGSNLLLKNKLYWYPRYGYLEPATYDIRYHYPSKWQVVSVGNKTEWQEVGDTASSRWRQDSPALGAAFAFGYFDSTAYRSWNDWPVTVYSTHDRSKGMREKIAGDVANSLYLFERLFGALPYGHLDVAETPGFTSQGFPGILFLTSFTYAQELAGVMEALRGHEAAHQWWGNLIGWQTYHDQWLSEGLAEYSGALVAQFLLGDDDKFFGIVDGWRSDLLEGGHIGVSLGLRRFGFSKQNLAESQGLQAGPIWLGRRLGDRYPIDYYLITYEKAAYVIHMLRTLLRDFETGSDERFWRMLSEFVAAYRDQRAETRDFIRLVQRHFDEDMSWFFEQWIFDTVVPTYIYSYEVVESPRDGFWLDLTVRQEEVPESFRMYVPVAVETKDERKVERILVTGGEKNFRLGPFSGRPLRVIFNDFKGVLARVKKR